MPGESNINTENNAVILDDIEANGGLCYYGVVSAEEAGSETTEFYCSNLVGWGNDDFIDLYYIQIRRTTDSGAPEYETQKISDYVSADGHFTVDTAFTADVNTGDIVNIIHESLVAQGRNDADNAFDSSNVVANRDGSDLERLEFIIEKVDGPAFLLDYVQSDNANAEEKGYMQFHIGLIDKESGAIAAADIDITAIVQTMLRSRATVNNGAFSAAGITQPVFAKDIGRVYDGYRFLDAQWQAGDVHRLTLAGIQVTIAGETRTLPTFVWSGLVEEAHDVKVIVTSTHDHVVDLVESPQINVGIPTFMKRPEFDNTEYYRVEIYIRDLDGDMADPEGNTVGVYVYDEDTNTRQGNLFQDAAGAAACTLIAAGDLTGFREAVRIAQGRYFFYYRVRYTHDLEELIVRLGWSDELYGAGETEYHVEATQVVAGDSLLEEIRDELDDLSEAPVFQVALQDLLIKPQTGTKYVRVEATFKDLDGDMADPNNNLIALYVYNNAQATRNTHLYKDVAGAAALDAAGIFPFGAYLALEREAQGLYYFYYQVEQANPLEELIFRFGWHDIIYYEDGPVAYHVEAAELVANGSVLDTSRRTTQDITSEVEITNGDRYTLTDGQLLKLQVIAVGISASATLTIRSALIETAPGAVDYEIHNDDVVVSATATDVAKTSATFTVNFPNGVTAADLAVYITSDDAGDTSVTVECNLIEVGGL